MYLNHFHFTEMPFSIAPNPRYLYMSSRHREALAHLLYGIESAGGIVVLTGEVGTGKTTLCRCLLEQMPNRSDAALIINPKMTAHELLATICDELTIRYDRRKKSIKLLIDAINNHLLTAHADGRHTVVIVDEAQQLSADLLEQLRLLTNLETNDKKLLQIVLLGQPELNTLLAQEHMRQLAQRITARYHLRPLSYQDTIAYVRHRLSVVGGSPTLLTGFALRHLHRASGGVPRMINIVVDRALLGAYAEGASRVGWRHVRRALVEVQGSEQITPPRQVVATSTTIARLPWLLTAMLGILLVWIVVSTPEVTTGWRLWLITLLSPDGA
ncbi:MAG: AAA family ATPase [Mariprofundales bacterium]|nr:AAA family ATPase [Mariprofundales bacterium]